MQRWIIVIFLGALLGAGWFVLQWVIFTPPSEQVNEPIQQPVFPSGEVVQVLPSDSGDSSSARVRIQTPSGETVEANNFVEQAGVRAVGADMYLLAGDEQSPSRNFSILYNESNGSFAISLDQPPFEPGRTAASEALRELLGITQGEACLLNVYVGVTSDQDMALAGKNLGLSYCDE